MSYSTQSFEYYSKENIETILKTLDNSKAANLGLIISQESTECRIQDWVNNLKLESDLIKLTKSGILYNLKGLQYNLDKQILPSIELIHAMPLEDITAYESMLINKIHIEKLNCNHNVNLLLHLKIITNHLIYKFKIFE
jgi:hypothetical protein